MRPNWLHRASQSASEGLVGHIRSRGEFHEAPGGKREPTCRNHEAPGVNCEPPGSPPRSAPKPPTRPGSSPRSPCPLRQVGERSERDFASATGASATQKRSLRNAHPPAFAAPEAGTGCWQDGDAAQQFRKRAQAVGKMGCRESRAADMQQLRQRRS